MKRLLLASAMTLALVGCQPKLPDFELENPKSGLYYEIFVRSFADSDGDGIGDLNGITEKLDYLVDLGVEGIWLMPIHPSTSYHGYDVTDYRAINEDYGTMADFEALVDAANEVGIDVMIDFVVNHSSNQHPWFTAAQRGEAPYKDYYVKNTNGTFYSYFGSSMPDLNLRNPEVIEEIYDIADFWIDKGVKGFRLDAAKHFFTYETPKEFSNATLMENVLFIRDLRTHLRSVREDAYVVSEVLDGSIVYTPFYSGSDSLFNFDVAGYVIGAANNGYSLTYLSRLASLYDGFAELSEDFIDAPMLRNHDQDRLAEALNGDLNRSKLAAGLYLLLPGNPFIYYGEEVGQFGYRVDGLSVPGYGTAYDETRRLPLKWGDDYTSTWFVPPTSSTYVDRNSALASIVAQEADTQSLLNYYQALGQLRKNTPALKYGNSFVPYNDNSVFPSDNNATKNSLLAFIRTYSQDDYTQSVMVIHNVADDSNAANVHAFLSLPEYESILFGEENTYLEDGRLWIKPQSTVVLNLKVNA